MKAAPHSDSDRSPISSHDCAAAPRRAGLALSINDTKLSIRQDDATDPSFRRQVFGGLIHFLRDRGWRVGPDAQIVRWHPSLRHTHRFARKAELKATIEIGGRAIEFGVWSENWAEQNRNGHRYDFGKREKMPFLTRLRVDLEFKKIVAWLAQHGPFEMTDRNLDCRGPQAGGITAIEYIERDYAASWHSDKALGRPICTQASNWKSADGDQIEHGATVWFADRSGRILRGKVFYHINNMWWVVAGPWDLRNLGSHEIFCRQPADLREKRNERRRRSKLEALLAEAISAMAFERAAKVRDLLFGKADVFLIWHREHGAYYRSNHSGYTTDRISAGRYTRAEAAGEVCRVPHLLSAIGLDGKRIEAADFARAPTVEKPEPGGMTPISALTVVDSSFKHWGDQIPGTPKLDDERVRREACADEAWHHAEDRRMRRDAGEEI